MNILGRAYRRFGPRYPQTALVLAMQLEHVVFAIGVGMLALYVDMTLGEFVLLLVGAILAEVAYNVLAARYTRRRLEPMARWIAGGRDPSTTQSAWRAGVSLPLDLVRTRLQNPFPTLTALIWACFAVWLLGLSPWAVPLLVGLAVLAAIYAVALIFFLSELLLRPVLDDIGGAGAPVSGSAGQLSAPLLWRMLATLPAISVISGVVSAGLSKGAQSGVGSFALAVVVAIGVACTLALALSVLLAGSIAIPVRRLNEATERVAEGDFGVRVPVNSTDETAELAESFNRMVAGLQERERLREAFGTFVDPNLAERVAREGTDLAGEELEVSILFLDVRGFTSFSERADAKTVVALLNELYDQVVPIVLEHGGHANKFIGDGLLAVFGAPERLTDHAERAVRAGLEIARTVADAYKGELRVGIGVNSGRVLVGTIGGGGRLDFTVIGDTVNTASRVESATRQTDDDMLITEYTRSLIGPSVATWVERPPVPLKGKQQAVRLFAPADGEAPPSAASVHPGAAPAAAADAGGHGAVEDHGAP